MLTSFRTHFLQNWKSGLTVALVSIPLSISLAVASQSTPIAGIITAVWAGLIASFFGGSNYNIIGPTGALSGILAAYASLHGAQTLPLLAVITGLIILVAYYFKLERFLIFVPGSTIHGFTIGVACIIMLSQLNSALGLKNLPQHKELAANAIESLKHLQDLSYTPFILFILSLLLLLFFARLRTVPGPIIVAPLGILVGYASSKGILPAQIATLGTTFGELQAHLFSKPELTFNASLLPTALTVAFIALIETMISARIADGITKTKHHKSQEIFGLGLANVVSGLMGGMPATAALARTSLNIRSGARNKLSQGISSIIIALISLGFLRYFTYMPLPVIAALLVMIAISMIEKEHMVKLFKYDKPNFAISLLVAFITVWQDPILGILVGTALSLILFAQKISHGYYELSVNGSAHNELPADPHYMVYSIKGPLAYINSQAHSARFQRGEFKYPKNVILRLRIYYLDLDGIDALNEIIEYLESKGNRVLLSEIKPHIAAILRVQSQPYTDLVNRGLVFETTKDAIEYLHSNKLAS